jgi:hypothetical protein
LPVRDNLTQDIADEKLLADEFAAILRLPNATVAHGVPHILKAGKNKARGISTK